MKKKRNKAQAILEYAVLVAVVIAAFLGMRTYVLKSVQAKFKSSADTIGQGEQYEPGVTVAGETKRNVR